MAQTYLMLLWHMHQPFYKDLAEDRYTMPWVRLHALKDYWGMVATLREFPSVHLTFNLVPSLVAQIEDYANATAGEPPYEVAFKPADKLTANDREILLGQAFQVNRGLLDRFPRFRELDEKVGAAGERPRPAGAGTPRGSAAPTPRTRRRPAASAPRPGRPLPRCRAGRCAR